MASTPGAPPDPERRNGKVAAGYFGQRDGPFVAAVEATRMPMVITDACIAGNPIVYANAAFLTLCGYEREEVLGRTYHFLAGPDTDPEMARAIDTATNIRHDITLEIQFHRKDGRSFWASQFVSPVTDGSGRVVQHFASFLDISDRKRMEAELRAAHADLDRRVRHRTRELEDANRRLRREVDRRQAVEVVLRDALSEKEFLVREVNHRVKNTLQRACALLAVQATNSGDQRVRDALDDAALRLVRMAEIHELLHGAGGYQSIDVARYLTSLGASLVESWQEDTSPVTLSVEADEVMWGPDLVLPLGLIVNEAVSNALKHAFPAGRQGAVTIALRRRSERSYRLAIRDDGVGIGPKRRSGSIGLKLIDALAGQIGGTVAIEADGGTLVAVTFTPEPRAGAH